MERPTANGCCGRWYGQQVGRRLGWVKEAAEGAAAPGQSMLAGRATAEGTRRFAGRFAGLVQDFRAAAGLTLSPLGIGTYLGEPDSATDEAYAATVRGAVAGGINVIDTAVNYRFQRSERSVGRALGALVEAGQVARDEILIATKGGYITFDGAVPEDPASWFARTLVESGILAGPEEVVDGSHCLAPRFLQAMLQASLANLSIETVDIYYLHNPESQLTAVERPEFLSRMRRAFEMLEEQVTAGRVAVYGTATWNGYRVEPADRFYLCLAELVGLARQIAGPDHHFRALQMPYNLAMTEAYGLRNQEGSAGWGSTLEVARDLGLTVFASAPLLQGRLARNLPAALRAVLGGGGSDARLAAQFARSTPGIDVVLVGMKSAEHLAETLDLLREPPLSAAKLQGLLQPS